MIFDYATVNQFLFACKNRKKINSDSNLEVTNIPSLGNQGNKTVAYFMLVYSFHCDLASFKII